MTGPLVGVRTFGAKCPSTRWVYEFVWVVYEPPAKVSYTKVFILEFAWQKVESDIFITLGVVFSASEHISTPHEDKITHNVM